VRLACPLPSPCLTTSRRGRYSLSARTLLELQSYLRAEYPDEVLECTICLEVFPLSPPLFLY
jgi:hypothetical protein